MIDWFRNIEFVNSWWLYLLLLLPVLAGWYFWRLKEQKVFMTISSARPIEGLTSWRTHIYPYLPILAAVAFVCLVLALARPQFSLKEEEVKAEGIR